ncbi:MAG TPA: helicase C-terminal domain-containing protein [Chthoniobacterales bacterium]|nr:helicase C-terminal domain-containing protein [Chthoniobacterales bacterium]
MQFNRTPSEQADHFIQGTSPQEEEPLQIYDDLLKDDIHNDLGYGVLPSDQNEILHSKIAYADEEHNVSVQKESMVRESEQQRDSLAEGELPEESSLRDQVAHIFSEKGPFSQMRGFEPRPEQVRMTLAIAEALENRTSLVVEAGTGVGKSLAYLIPAVLYAVQSRRKAIICTHTINLQEQLLYKDLLLLEGMLKIPFDVVLLKGRQNYLCPTRLKRAMDSSNDLFAKETLPELEKLRLWSETTSEGTLSDLPYEPDPQLWAQVCSERHFCTPKTCGNNPRCFYQSVRRRALSAQVLILNHTLFFTLIEDGSNSESGYLTSNDFVIFDEAHTIEGIASRHLGLSVSQYGLKQVLHRLYNPRTYKGLFQQLKATAPITAVVELLPLVDTFFESIALVCDFQKGKEYRIREKQRLELQKAVKIEALLEKLDRLHDMTEATAEKIDANDLTKSELIDLAAQLLKVRSDLLEFMKQSHPEDVYWVEKTGKASNFYALHAVPVSIAPHLKQLLFRKNTSAILTSATLSTGSPQLDYFRSRIGAMKIPALQLGSPFNYEEQMKLHLVRKMPDPRHADYESSLEHWIAHFTEQSKARTFVLFTSYRTMQALAQKMQSFFDKKGWTLLVQGEELSRARMLEEFRSGKPCVLFGTDSFWTGVDIPGEALSNVMITRLPFTTPDHPLTEAKLEQIESSGGNSFRDYSLPEAILKLRQGVGRLIRNKSDSGIVVILDSRVVGSFYGKAFLKALPQCPVEIV